MEKTTRFRELGYFLVPNFVDAPLVRQIVEQFETSGKYRPVCEMNINSPSGISRHAALDRFAVDSITDEVGRTYEDALRLANEALSEQYFASPYQRSAYYAKRYSPPNDNQGWHQDTNCLTGILYMTDNDEGATELECRDGAIKEVLPESGNLMILDGTKIRHRAQEVHMSTKVTVLFNFYRIGHARRDPDLDRLIFGG